MAKEVMIDDYMKDTNTISLNPTNSVLEGDVEAIRTPGEASTGNLHRGLKARHISMIGLAGSIGTGLIIGTYVSVLSCCCIGLPLIYSRGAALARAGPASLFIAYCMVGLNVYVTMTAVGEMATYLPTGISFSGYADRFVDPALGFSLGRFSCVSDGEQC
jgi:amino acid transporter